MTHPLCPEGQKEFQEGANQYVDTKFFQLEVRKTFDPLSQACRVTNSVEKKKEELK